jgi:hypothetical protein
MNFNQLADETFAKA